MVAHGVVFFFNDTATTEIYTLSLHDALPILRLFRSASVKLNQIVRARGQPAMSARMIRLGAMKAHARSEEHTSELQSRQYLVCRLLLEKKTTASVRQHAVPPTLIPRQDHILC